MWNKIKAWFENSMTILWARIQVVAGAMVAAAFALLQNPDVTNALQAALQPRFIPYYVIAIGLITELARRRTVARPTDANNEVVG